MGRIYVTRGMTLVETLIYIGLMCLLLVGFISFALNISSLREKNFAIQEVHDNSRVAINLISQKIKEAKSVVSPLNTGSTSSDLVLEDNTSPSVNITFHIIGGVLYFRDTNGEEIRITSGDVLVDKMVFTRLSAIGDKANIGIEITVAKKPGGSAEYNYSQTINTAINIKL